MAPERTVLVTGVSGDLGSRLVPLLADFRVVGVDMRPPESSPGIARFVQMDLGREVSCRQMMDLLRDSGAEAVVHLAFVLDPLRTGVLDEERMWQINVAGTARVMEAISVVNRTGGHIGKFIFTSSISVYGPEPQGPVSEDCPLQAHTLPYGIHKRESDEVVRYRAESLGACRTYVLRPPILTGPNMQNYMACALRGTALGNGRMAARLRAQGKRLPLMLPRGKHYLQNRWQFAHVDDVARLIAHLLRREKEDPPVNIFNVAGSGEVLTLQQCVDIAQANIKRVPSRAAYRAVLKLLWRWGISSIPPAAMPYILGSCIMDTARLQRFLGDDYARVIQYSNDAALRDNFR